MTRVKLSFNGVALVAKAAALGMLWGGAATATDFGVPFGYPGSLFAENLAGQNVPGWVPQTTISISIPAGVPGFAPALPVAPAYGSSAAAGRGLQAAEVMDENPLEDMLLLSGVAAVAGLEAGGVIGVMSIDGLQDQAYKKYNKAMFEAWDSADRQAARAALQSEMASARTAPYRYAGGGALLAGAATLAVGYALDPAFSTSCQRAGTWLLVESPDACKAVGGVVADSAAWGRGKRQ